MLSALPVFILYNYIGLIQYDRLIFRNQCFHNNPTDQVSYCAYAEDYKVTGRLPSKPMNVIAGCTNCAPCSSSSFVISTSLPSTIVVPEAYTNKLPATFLKNH